MNRAVSAKLLWSGHYLNVALALVAAALFTVACTGHDISTDSFSDEPVVGAVEQVQGEGLTFEEFLQFQERVGDGCYIFERDVLVCNEEEMQYLYHKSGASGDLALGAHTFNNKAMQWDEQERRRLTYCVDKQGFDLGWAMANRPESEGGKLTCTADDAARRPQQSASNFTLDNPGLRWALQKGESCTSGDQCASGNCSAGKCGQCAGGELCVRATAQDCTLDSQCMSGSCGATEPGICDACTTTAACGLCPAGEACYNGRPFRGNYDRAVEHMQQTADEWARHVGVEFVYIGDEIDPRTGKTIDEESCNPAAYPMYHAGSDTDTYQNGLWPEDYPLFFVRPMYSMWQDSPALQADRDAWGHSPFRFDGTCSPINGLAFFPWYLKHYYIGNPEEEEYAWGGGFMNRTLAINTGLQLPSWYPHGVRDESCPTCSSCHEVAIEMAMTTWPDGDGGFGPNCESIPRKACPNGDSDCFSQNCGTDGYCEPGLPLYGYYKPDTCPKCPTTAELNDPEVCMNANYRDMDMFAFSCDGYGAHSGTFQDLNYVPNDLRGLLLHETGHILGLTHEHGAGGYAKCPEFNEIYDNDLDLRMDDRRTDVTVYDPSSTMHYPWCEGTGDYSLSPLDVCGTQVLYPPDEGDLGKEADGFMTALTYVDGFLSDDDDKDGWRDFCDEAGPVENVRHIGLMDPSVDPNASPVGSLLERVHIVKDKEIDINDPQTGKDAIANLLVVAGTRFKVIVEPYTPATAGCSTPRMEMIVGSDKKNIDFNPPVKGWAWNLNNGNVNGCIRPGGGNRVECDIVVPGTPGDIVNASAQFRPNTTNCVDYKVSFWYVEPCATDIDLDGICDGLDDNTVGVDHTFDGNYVDLPVWPVQTTLSVMAYNFNYEPAEIPPYQRFYPLGCTDIVDDVYVMADIGTTADCSGEGYLADDCNVQMYVTYEIPYDFDMTPPGGFVDEMWDGKAGRWSATKDSVTYDQICFSARYAHRQGPTSAFTGEQWLDSVQTLNASFAANVKTWRECADPNDTCMHDLSGDGVVNGDDLDILSACWGSDPEMECRLADFNCDGQVSFTDQTALMGAYGNCGSGGGCTDSDGDGFCDSDETCDSDPLKQAPGQCGCGIADIDSDGDGSADCVDECDSDPAKTLAGECGCGVPEGTCGGGGGSGAQQDIQTGSLGGQQFSTDYVYTVEPGSTFDARTLANTGSVTMMINWDGPADYANYVEARYMIAGQQYPVSLTVPAGTTQAYVAIIGGSGAGGSYTLTVDWVGPGGACTDTDGDGECDDEELCDNDPNKTVPGVCGCGVEDIDNDLDGVYVCHGDQCDNDINKTLPGECGCGVPEGTCGGGGEQTDELSDSTPPDAWNDHIFVAEPGTAFSVTIDATAGAGFLFVQWNERGGFGSAQCDKYVTSGQGATCTLTVPGSGVAQVYVSVKGTASGISYDLSTTYTPAGGGGGPQQDIQTGSLSAYQYSQNYVYTVEPGSTFDARTLANTGSVYMYLNWDAPASATNNVDGRMMQTGEEWGLVHTVPAGTTQAYISIKGGNSGGSYTLTVDYLAP